MSQNLASNHFDPAQWAAVDAGIGALEQALVPLLVAMAADDRRRVVKMGDGSEAFCRKALDVMTENSALLPRNLDVAEMRRDLDTHDALNARMVRLVRLLEKVRDTDTALGSDAMACRAGGICLPQDRRQGRRHGQPASRPRQALREQRSAQGGNGVGSRERLRLAVAPAHRGPPQPGGLFVDGGGAVAGLSGGAMWCSSVGATPVATCVPPTGPVP